MTHLKKERLPTNNYCSNPNGYSFFYLYSNFRVVFQDDLQKIVVAVEVYRL